MSSRSSTSSSNLPLIIGTVVVLAAAVGFAVLGGGDDGGDFDLETIAAPEVEEGAGPAQPGSAAPVVTAASLLDDGEETLPVEGEATMIVFLAHWCPACNERVPQYTEWLEENELPEGVQVRAVATAIDPQANHFPPDDWLERRDWPTPALVDTDGSIAQAYGVAGYPYWVFVDADGTVVQAGNVGDVAELQQVATALASG